MQLRVRLNATDTNHWHRFGLTQNPFPQIAKAELGVVMRQLGSLDGDPIKGPDDLRIRLDGWSEEFISICLRHYKPGERVEFDVDIPDQYL